MSGRRNNQDQGPKKWDGKHKKASSTSKNWRVAPNSNPYVQDTSEESANNGHRHANQAGGGSRMGDAFPVNHKPVRTGFSIPKKTTPVDTSKRDTTNSKTDSKMSSDAKTIKPYTVSFSEAPRCWVSVVDSPVDLGQLINLLPAHLMRAICQIIAQPIGVQKWKLDQAKVAGVSATRGRGQGATPQVIKRSLFGPASGPQSATYNPRAQLSVTAFHPRDLHESRFHMPAEESMFDVKIHFIHLVRGLKVVEGAGCRQYRESTQGIIKIVPIVEITDKPGEKAFLGKERDAWFEVSESEIATFEGFKTALKDRNLRGLQTLIMDNHVQGAVDGTWTQLVSGANEIFVIRSHLVGKPFEPTLDKHEVGLLEAIPITKEKFTEWALAADDKDFKPSKGIWGDNIN